MSSANFLKPIPVQKRMKHFVVLVMVLTCYQVTSEKIECYFDGVCDNFQYCNKDEERCSYCICEPQPVVPECLEICAKQMVTTTSRPTNPVSGDNTYMIIGISILLGFALAVAGIVGYFYVTKKYCFANTQTPTSSATSSPASSAASSKDTIIDVAAPLIPMKAKLPIEERGHEQFEDSYNKIHTSPTADLNSEQHKPMIDPNGIAIFQNKCQTDDETFLKQPA